jgi:hypothetical protein
MAARVLDPKTDFAWLSEIEQDLALLMEPRSKFDRLVLAERLVEAGLTLVTEAEAFSRYPFKRAIDIRNGLIIALLAVCPIRIKNYAALEIGRPSNRSTEAGGLRCLTAAPRPKMRTSGLCLIISMMPCSFI